MEYKGYKILARVWESTADLYDLNPFGGLESNPYNVGLPLEKEILWYEIDDDVGGSEYVGMQFNDVHSAKKFIDSVERGDNF